MSQFTFTAEEDALVVTSLQYLAEVQTASHGNASDDVKALLAKMAAQQAPVVVEEAPVVTKSKKAKTEEAPAEEAPAAE
jgi:hypothetical protein